MRKRAETLGAELSFNADPSLPEEGGSQVELVIPLAPE